MVIPSDAKQSRARFFRSRAIDQTTRLFDWEPIRAGLVLAAVLWYLGVSPISALLAPSIWIAQGVTGAWIISQFSARVNREHELLFVLGPGALLGIGATTATFLLSQGGVLGTTLTLGLLMFGSIAWFHARPLDQGGRPHTGSTPMLLLACCALFANSREFPSLLMPSIALFVLGLVWDCRATRSYRIIISAGACGLLAFSAIKRSTFWWWVSDDTTLLSAMGTMVVKRGHIADTAGWPTDSYHWFLHAWLALWNQQIGGYIFETYQVVWPFIAGVSVFASLWLTLSYSLGANLSPLQLLFLGLAGAGLIRLEWPAPQQQQPFLFAMVGVGAWWLNARSKHSQISKLRALAGLSVIGILIPIVLYLAKPSLIAAWGLLVAGAVIEFARRRYRLNTFACLVLAASVVVAGVSMMRIGSSWVSGRYITSFDISYLSPELGWCERSSLADILTCIFSLEVTLMFAFAIAIIVLTLWRFPASTRTLVVLVLPLVLAYLPFRLLVSSGTYSGASSFYVLPVMGMMTVILLALAVLLSTKTIKTSAFAMSSIMALFAVQLGTQWDLLSDPLGPILLRSVVSQYLSSLDVAVLILAVAGAVCVASVMSRRNWFTGMAAATCCAVSVVPAAHLISEAAKTEDSVLRTARPSDYLGPADIEDVAVWLREHSAIDTLIATNYLCTEDRVDECRRSSASTTCASKTAELPAGWVLPALSEREFLYLSQGWFIRPRSVVLHDVSTRLGSEISQSSIDALVVRGVNFYVASREHSSQVSWRKFIENASFVSENFAIVSIGELRRSLQ